MPNLFAACRMEGELLVKRVRLNAAVQQAVIDLFEAQERDFRAGVTTEVPFTGNWNPDPEEILTIDVPQEAQVFEAVIRGNATAVPTSLYWWMRVIAPRQANTAGIANSP